MKFFGHPLHPLFVHFPTALLPMDFVMSLIYYSNNDSSFALASFYCLAGGTLTGFVSILTGLADLLIIPKKNKEARATGLYHGFINAVVILVFTVLTYQAWQYYPHTTSSVGILLVKGILIFTLFAGNYLGGRLIYKHHIGLNIKEKEHEHFTSHN